MALSTNDKQRFQVHYSGRVQGVGFRAILREIAQAYAVQGFGKNLSSGQVLLVVEGQPAELQSYLAAIAGRMGENLDRVEVVESPPTGEFSGFEIR